MRAYLRLDPHLADKKAEYPDGAHRAFVDSLCFAEQQPQRGRFRNEKLLRVLLEKRARWVPFLIAKGDLHVLNDGRIYVDGWDEWQEGDVTVPERMARLRARKSRNDTPDVTPAVTPATVTAPYSGGGSGRHIAEAVGGAPSRAPNGAGPESPPTFMGFRQRTALEDIKRQEQEAWTAKCGECGVVKRKHPSGGDHPFRVEQAVKA